MLNCKHFLITFWCPSCCMLFMERIQSIQAICFLLRLFPVFPLDLWSCKRSLNTFFPSYMVSLEETQCETVMAKKEFRSWGDSSVQSGACHKNLSLDLMVYIPRITLLKQDWAMGASGHFSTGTRDWQIPGANCSASYSMRELCPLPQKLRWAWCPTPLIPAPGRQRQADLCEFKDFWSA